MLDSSRMSQSSVDLLKQVVCSLPVGWLKHVVCWLVGWLLKQVVCSPLVGWLKNVVWKLSSEEFMSSS